MPEQPAQILRFRAGVVALALDAAVVRRIVPFPRGLVRLDRERHHCGVFRDEGTLVSVIDLRVVLGQKERCSDQPPVVIIESGGRHYGLLVDAVEGLVPAGRGRPASLPRPLPAGLFRRTWLIGEDLVLELDAACVIRAQPLPAGWHTPFFPQAAPARAAQPEQPSEPPTESARPHGTPRPASGTSGSSPPVAPAASHKLRSGAEHHAGRGTVGGASPGTKSERHASAHPPLGQEKTAHEAAVTPGPAPQRAEPSPRSSSGARRRSTQTVSRATVVETHGAHGPAASLQWPERAQREEADYEESGGGSGVLVWLLLLLPLVAAGLLLWWLVAASPSAISPRPRTEPPRYLLAAIPESVRAPGRSLDAPWPPPRASAEETPMARDTGGPANEAPPPGVTVLAEDDHLSLTRKGRSLILHLKADADAIRPNGAPAATAGKEGGLAAPASLGRPASQNGTSPNPPRPAAPDRHGDEGAASPPARQAVPGNHPGEADRAARPCTPRLVTRRMTHVVRRGDTLWDIAIRYLGTPWRYPELARLSRIRDPDLIYPGDRVIILLEQRQPCPSGKR